MLRALSIAATGMQAQALNVDVIANNLANVNTVGFKKSRADFQDLLYQTLRAPGSESAEGTEVPTGIQLGQGTRPAAVQKIYEQGNYEYTRNELDLAIEGDGFFQILQPNGETAYTRNGSFKLDGEGRIFNSDGYLLEPETTIPPDSMSLSVGTDGTVSVIQTGEVESTVLGTISIVKFANPSGLNNLGRGLVSPTSASGTAQDGTAGEDGFGIISQGYLEMSNVSVVDEMVNMITAQRAYEVNSKAISTADEMLQMANNIKR